MSEEAKEGEKTAVAESSQEEENDSDMVEVTQAETVANGELSEKGDESTVVDPDEPPPPPLDQQDVDPSTGDEVSSEKPATAINQQADLKSNAKTRKGWKIRKRGRRVRVAAVDDSKAANEDSWHIHELPSNQYETDLRRRAIFKGEGEAPKVLTEKPKIPSSPEFNKSSRRSIFASVSKSEDEGDSPKDDFSGYDEETGDVSLGMKLNM